MYNRQNFLTAALASLLMLGLSIPAMALVSPITEVKNSSEFEWRYEFEGDTADLLDSLAIDLDGNSHPDFSSTYALGTNTVQDGVWSASSTELGGYNLFGTYIKIGEEDYQRDDNALWPWMGFHRLEGFTIEVRIKITSGVEEGDEGEGAFTIYGSGEDSWVSMALKIRSDGVSWHGTPIVSVDNTDDFHTYRIALELHEWKNLEKYSLWRDGVLIRSDGSFLTGSFYSMLNFGDGAGVDWGSADIDYVRIGFGSWAPTWVDLGTPGDADADGDVDGDDAMAVAANWLTAVDTWGEGDFNGDGVVDDIDATLMAANWTGPLASSVPEPSSLILLLGLLGLAAFYRRAR